MCLGPSMPVDGVTAHARDLDLGKDQKLEGERHWWRVARRPEHGGRRIALRIPMTHHGARVLPV